ncbi:MAG TPA: FAD/NAD(P)-binding oxidoreductase [Candidatus Eisenbacteria bacterium]|nr:FAD/NAD(P)-binding oxidoreductase [Candidatus Eisenbacteria bacterium]
MSHHTYVLVGGGVASAAAIEGIRAHDPNGTILLLSRENHAPYQRPPLTKGLWFGKTTLDELPVHDAEFYRTNGVELALRREVVELDAARHVLTDERGIEYGYDKLLLATGGRPRRLPAEGAEVEEVHYFRDLEDYLLLRQRSERVEHTLVVGGGFIGTELAAALRHVGREVTLLYAHEYPLANVFPRDLGLSLAEFYRERGIETVSNERVTGIEEGQGLVHARTASGGVVTTQLVVAGVGIAPQVDLADVAGLEVDDGIVVDEFTRSSDPDIHAAGDVAEFPSLALQRRLRVEHWEHARDHGRCAGANMAGAGEPYTALPFFYGDFFELGFEAVGELDSSLEVEAVWREPYREGVLYYLREDVVRGVLLWNVWNAVDWARGMVREARPTTRAAREAAVPASA